jgi:cell wall-associated NlpC family hydrolase
MSRTARQLRLAGGTLLAFLVAATTVATSPSPVAARAVPPHVPTITMPATYTASNAVAYAERWALSRNPAYNSLGSDCTNFVSQALRAGGFTPVRGSNTHIEVWYSDGTSGNSNTWSVAPMLLNFLWVHSPGGILTAYWTPLVGLQASGTSPGGLIFYDWGWLNVGSPGNGEGVSHVSMVVANGVDPNSGWRGDLVDQHTTDRYHAYWTLEPYNGANGSTAFTVVGISRYN